MIVLFTRKILITLCTATLLVSCSSQKTEEIDISALQLIPKKEKEITTKVDDVVTPVENNLKPLLNKDQLNSTINFGKENPFAPPERENDAKIQRELNDANLKKLKLTGFLSINNNKYALVNYMNKSGSLTSDSIGGINSDLLPDGAKVKEINSKQEILVLDIDDQNYEIFLD